MKRFLCWMFGHDFKAHYSSSNPRHWFVTDYTCTFCGHHTRSLHEEI